MCFSIFFKFKFDDGDQSSTSSPPPTPSVLHPREPSEQEDVAIKEPEKVPLEPESTEIDDVQEALIKKYEREAHFKRSNIFLFISIFGSWLLGQADFSFAWIILLLGIFYVIWQGSLKRLVEDTVVFEKLRVHRRRALQNIETAEWLNFVVNRWWMFSSRSIFDLIKASLDPLLNYAKPTFLDSIQLTEFSLGDGTPVFKSIKAFDITSGQHIPITHMTVGKPPLALTEKGKCVVALEAEVGLHCPDYRMVLSARAGGKGVGVDLDVAMEKLNIDGKLQMIFHLSTECPFPHLTKISFSFLEKPEIWFNIRILKSVQMMEVPVLKTWVHSLVMDALTNALVDPGKLDLNLNAGAGLGPSFDSAKTLAQGVLTVVLSRSSQQISKLSTFGDEERWCVIRIGDQRHVTTRLNTARWQECRTFLVENLTTDKVCIKMKSKRLISTITLMQEELPLVNYNFDKENNIIETVLQKKGPKGSLSTPPLNLRMEYTPLPLIQNNVLVDEESGSVKSSAGVMYICVHNATDLVAPDKRGTPNPYCVILCNRKKIKTTHYVLHTLNPKWETCIEFLVADYLQMVISFAVCNWDVTKMVDSDLLGLASLGMKEDEPVIQRKQIPLTFNVSSSNPEDKGNGSLTVTAIFRPVPSVSESDESQLLSSANNNSDDEDSQSVKTKKNNPSNFMQTAKMLLSNTKDSESFSSVDFSDILSSGSGLMELTVVRAKDLVAKDLNGFSDPYCEIKIDEECKFKTSCKKKTLNPEWDESATIQLPKANEVLNVTLWDRDPLGMRDFLGIVTLNLEEIKQHSAKDNSEWFTLKDTESGEIELKIKVISEDLEKTGNSSEPPLAFPLHDLTQAYSRSTSPALHGRTLPLAVPTPILPKNSPAPLILNSYTNQHSPQFKRKVIEETKTEASNIRAISSATVTTTTSTTVTSTVCANVITTATSVISSTATTTTTSNNITATLTTTEVSCDGNRKTTVPEHSPSVESVESSTVSQGNDPSPTKDSQNIRRTPQYSSIRAMKQKMKDGFSHPLRRFRSEVNVHESKSKTFQDRVTIEPQNPENSNNGFDSLIQAKSQPDISSLVPVSIDINEEQQQKSHYFNIQGKVIQGLGFKAHQNLIYCRVRFSRGVDKRSKSANGKTICKSSMIAASINPHFDTEFQLDGSSGVAKTCALTFDIRSDKKETIASTTVTLEELFGDNNEESAEVQKWFALSNGTKLEIEISHGKPIDKKSNSAIKLFRSWSVHRIGKI